MNNKSEKEKLPYKDEDVHYVYGIFNPEIVVLPLGIVWDLLEAWKLVKKLSDDKISFSEAIKFFEYHLELENYCQSCIDNGNGDDQFGLSMFFTQETDFCNITILMDEYMPNDFLDKPFVKYSHTGYLEDIIIINSEDENIFLKYFEDKGEEVKRNDTLMKEALRPDWFYNEY